MSIQHYSGSYSIQGNVNFSWNRAFISVVYLLFFSTVAQAMGKELVKRVDETLEQCGLEPPCHKLGKLDLCWDREVLAPGVTHYRAKGKYASLNQRFEVIAIDHSSKARLTIQDARGVLKKGEKPKYGRLRLDDLAGRIPGSIAAISGGYFHYDVPDGKYYKWDGPPYVEGDPIGELVVNRKIIGENFKEKWGAVRINSKGRVSIVDTQNHPLDVENPPKYALGAGPLMIQKGRVITEEEIPLPQKSTDKKQVVSSGDYSAHGRGIHARAGICQTGNKDTLFVMVEGGQYTSLGAPRKGMAIVDFATFLEALDCKNALNLDGGGTADLVTRKKSSQKFKSTIISAAPEGGKRPLASAIVVVVR